MLKNLSDVMLIGTAPSIGDYDLKKLQGLITNVGLNYIIKDFQDNLDYWIFSDNMYLEVAQRFYRNRKVKVLAPYFMADKLRVFAGVDPVYDFKFSDKLITEFNPEQKLTYRKFTFIFAVTYLYCLGVKNIYLAGIELDPKNWIYYSGGKNTTIIPAVLNEAIETLFKYKELFEKRGGNIYTLYKGDKLGLPYVSSQELIQRVLKLPEGLG